MNVSEVLNKAADLIEERGWATGNCGMKTTGPTCLEGALAAALGTPVDVWLGPKFVPSDLDNGDIYYSYDVDLHDSPAYIAVADYLSRECGALYAWNDRQTSAEPVIEALRAAAIIAAAQETDTRVLTPELDTRSAAAGAVR